MNSDNSPMLKILTLLHTMPNIKSYRTIVFENLLPVLRTKTSVHVTWLVYMPEKLNSSSHKDPDITILDIHDFKNAAEVIRKVKPDIIYASPNLNLPDYSLALAGKFLGIPVVGELVNELFIKTSLMESTKLYISQFFQSSVPTDLNSEQRKFMKRGRFFIYKYLFLLRTQRAVKMSWLKIIQDFFMLIKVHITIMRNLYDPRFAVSLHFVENETLIESLVKKGFQRSTLVVTGNPMYDLVEKKLQELQPIDRKGSKISLLLLTHAMYEHGVWTREQRDSLIKAIVTEISKYKDEMSIVVKIHPSSEIITEYQAIINPLDPSIPIYKEGDVINFINEADVVISYSTASALVNALILKKPIIICNFFNLERDLFLEKGLVLECKTQSDLIRTIKQSLSFNPATREKVDEFIREFFYKFDGDASERVSNAIIDLLHNHYEKGILSDAL